MKKVAGVILSLFIIFFSFITFSYAESSASDGAILVATPTPEIQYTFAYPGILPDNPLHFLKAGRDRIIGFLINDTVKKAEFNLLTSDKRVFAAELLMGKNKEELAITTLSKSNNYLHEAIGSAITAKNMGKNIDTVLSNLQNGLKKRKEVFAGMREKVSDERKAGLELEIKRLAEYQKSIDKLSSK